MDLNGKMPAHPHAGLVRKEFMAVKDANGKTFAGDLVTTAQEKGSGWVDYKWENPATKAVDPKTVYFERVDDLILCSGAYKSRADDRGEGAANPANCPSSSSLNFPGNQSLRPNFSEAAAPIGMGAQGFGFPLSPANPCLPGRKARHAANRAGPSGGRSGRPFGFLDSRPRQSAACFDALAGFGKITRGGRY